MTEPSGAGPADDVAAPAAAGFACVTVDGALAFVLGRDAGGSDASALQAHLDDCTRCRLLVSEAVRGIDAAERADRRPTAPTMTARATLRTLRDGDVLLGRYEIVRLVARGGMGEVYEARDVALSERVALKTLACTLLDDQRATDRFVAEVQLARQIAHENVCRIFEFGVHRKAGSAGEESIPFLTMEFLAGETLGKRIARKGRLPEREILHVLRQMVAGLGAVHAAGIVHRDFKSDNVLVLSAGASKTETQRRPRRVVVTDFGLARSLDGLRVRGWTTGPFVVGTVDYMAPEQLEGKPPTRAFDVYALGVVLYEMLTGRRPQVAAGTPDPMRRFPGSTIPLPSALVPGIDAGWDRIVGRCLERNPANRFENVEDVLGAAELMFVRRGRLRGLRRAIVPVGVGLAMGAGAALAAVALWRG